MDRFDNKRFIVSMHLIVSMRLVGRHELSPKSVSQTVKTVETANPPLETRGLKPITLSLPGEETLRARILHEAPSHMDVVTSLATMWMYANQTFHLDMHWWIQLSTKEEGLVFLAGRSRSRFL